jgi:hypothetical protein
MSKKPPSDRMLKHFRAVVAETYGNPAGARNPARLTRARRRAARIPMLNALPVNPSAGSCLSPLAYVSEQILR